MEDQMDKKESRSQYENPTEFNFYAESRRQADDEEQRQKKLNQELRSQLFEWIRCHPFNE